MKHKNNLGTFLIVGMSFFLTLNSSLHSSEVKEAILQSSHSLNLNYLSSDEFCFTEEELKNAIEIPTGLFTIPSEEATAKFIEDEDLSLLGTGEQASTKAAPRIGLSIDGGGIRGIMPALWLKDLSNAFQEEQEVGITNPRLYQVFDYVGGTSIGGIVALGVAADLYPETIVDLFEKHGSKIFSKKERKAAWFKDFFGILGCQFSSKNLEDLLKEKFTETATLHSTKTNVLITACTENGHPWLFRKEDNENYKLWEVARSTSAAPTYFESFKPTLHNHYEALVDGGIWVNNPATLVTASMVKYYNSGTFDPNKLYMLSLGTGDTDNKPIPQNAGKLHVATILEALMSSHSRGNHMMMTQLLGNHYHRINPKLEQFIDLSDANSIGALKSYAQQEEHALRVKAFVEQIKEIVREKLEKANQ